MKNLTNALSTGRAQDHGENGRLHHHELPWRTAVRSHRLNKDVIDEYFTGTTSRVGGVGLDELAEEVAIRHRVAYPSQWTARPHRNLRTGGEYKWRRTGEDHLNDPEAIFLLQQSTQRGDYDMFKKYSAHINDTSNRLMTLRG